MNVIYGVLLAGILIIGVMVMAEKVEDSRAQRIRAEVALVRANADAREGRMAMTIIALAGAGVMGLLIVAMIAVTWNKNDNTHTVERIIERRVIICVNEGTKRDFYKALSSGEVRYIDS